MIDFPRRGEIWLTRLDPTVGAEIKKTRPALIISNNVGNRYSPLVTVLPVSDKGSTVYPFEAALTDESAGLTKPSKVKCQQIRTVDKKRLLKVLGHVDVDSLLAVEKALRLHLDIR